MTELTKEEILDSRKTDVFNKEDETSKKNTKIMTFNFLLNAFFLLPPDGATPFVNLVYKVIRTSILVIDVITLSCQLIAIAAHWGNIPLIASTMSVMNGLTVSFITCIYFILSQTKFVGLVDLLRTEFVSKVKSKYIRFIQNAERQVKIDVLLSTPIVLTCCFMWTVLPLFNSNLISNVEDKNITTADHYLERMIFVMWAPFETIESPQYEIVFLLQFAIVSLAIMQLYAVDIMFLCLMSHAAAQFKVLQVMLDDMDQNISENDLQTAKIVDYEHVTTDDSFRNTAHGSISLRSRIQIDDNSENPGAQMTYPKDDQMFEDKCRDYLVKCIKYHQAIIEFVDYLNEVVSFPTFLKIVNLPILICMTGFQMTQTVGDQKHFFKFASLLAGSLYLIFSYCWFGQQVINESEEVATALYGTDWYNQKPGFKRLLPLSIMNASRPVKVKGGVFYDMSFVTLASIVNVSYSYFTMLIQLNDS